MSRSAFRKVSHVIFDMDGLLLDTEPIYERMVAMITKEHGSPYPKDVRMKVMGTTEQRTGQIVIEDLKLPITVPQFLHRLTELSRVQLQSPPLLRGAERLVRHLHKNNVPIALATSSGKDMVEVKTEKHMELFSLFNHKVMGSTDPDVKEGKPAPDIFLVAAKRFADAPAPDQCLVFEDAPNGVRAAKLAEMQVVMVPDEHMKPDLSKEATLVLKSLMDFKPELFGLPPFDDSS